MADNSKEPPKTSAGMVIQCHICNRWVTTSGGQLMRHMKKFHETNNDKCRYPCPACFHFFTRKQNYDDHCKRVHDQILPPLPPVIIRRPTTIPVNPTIIKTFTIPQHKFKFRIIKGVSSYISAKTQVIKPFVETRPIKSSTTSEPPKTTPKKRHCPLPPDTLSPANGTLTPPSKTLPKVPKLNDDTKSPMGRKQTSYEIEQGFNMKYKQRMEEEKRKPNYDSDSHFKIPKKSPRKPSGHYMPPKKASPVDHQRIKDRSFIPTEKDSPRHHLKENLTRKEKESARILFMETHPSPLKTQISSKVEIPPGSTINKKRSPRDIPTRELGVVKPTHYSPILSMPDFDTQDFTLDPEIESFLSEGMNNDILNSTSNDNSSDLGNISSYTVSSCSSYTPNSTTSKEYKDCSTQTARCEAKYHTDKLLEIITDLEQLRVTPAGIP